MYYYEHMQRISFIFPVIISFFVLTVAIPSSVFAKDAITAPVENTKTNPDIVISDNTDATVSASPQPVNYELAYPGMLPDNPLYFLKMIRDKIIKLLINDPYKKVEFDVLNSEKRTYAAKFLVEKGKSDLAIDTISKGNNYFAEGITEITKTKKTTRMLPLLDRMRMVLQKNTEVITAMTDKMDEGQKKKVTVELKRIQDMQKTVDQLIESKKG